MTGCHQLVQGSFRHSYEVGPLVPGLRSLSPDTGCSEGCRGLASHTQLLEGKGAVCIHSTNTVSRDGAVVMSQTVVVAVVHVSIIKPQRPSTHEAL